ncbi:glycoside hydrolase family 25 protein [Jiulongibacter sp. NS-SX5]|uniref:glycoside hydrolase family 25 protein n=1 Tax=Jiulongibacter sp. NS-SX5 TaxID=3463854 RepID=UPI004059CAC7
MRKRKNHTTWVDRTLNLIFRPNSLYFLVLTFFIATYPSSVTDGMLAANIDSPNLRIPLRYNTHGVDISHHNGDINWDKVIAHSNHHSSVKFCFIKATEGTDLIDKRFSKNWEELHSRKIRKGAYHFYSPQADPRLQALNYILNVKLTKGDFVPVLDWEVLGRGRARRDIVKNVTEWLEIIEKHYGVKPIIYTNRYIYQTYIKEHFEDYPLWISQYFVPEPVGFDMSQVYFWQYSTLGNIEGIESNVDFNVFLKDDFEFERVTLRQ